MKARSSTDLRLHLRLDHRHGGIAHPRLRGSNVRCLSELPGGVTMTWYNSVENGKKGSSIRSWAEPTHDPIPVRSACSSIDHHLNETCDFRNCDSRNCGKLQIIAGVQWLFCPDIAVMLPSKKSIGSLQSENQNMQRLDKYFLSYRQICKSHVNARSLFERYHNM